MRQEAHNDGEGSAGAGLRGKTCFVGIGAQKAGTNWLAGYFEHHPEIYLSAIKELHYFDWAHLPEFCGGWEEDFEMRLEAAEKRAAAGVAADRKRARDLRKRLEMAGRPGAYLEYFEERVGEEKVFGEISPSYSMMGREGFAAMKALLPEPRILFILRNPADRFWSQLRFTAQQRAGFSPRDEFARKLDAPQYVLRTDYARTLKEVCSVFERREVLVLFYEDLFLGGTREEELKKITDFLGVDCVPGDFEQRVAVSVEMELEASLRRRAVRRFRRVYEEVAAVMGRVPESWAKDMGSG